MPFPNAQENPESPPCIFADFYYESRIKRIIKNGQDFQEKVCETSFSQSQANIPISLWDSSSFNYDQMILIYITYSPIDYPIFNYRNTSQQFGGEQGRQLPADWLGQLHWKYYIAVMISNSGGKREGDVVGKTSCEFLLAIRYGNGEGFRIAWGKIKKKCVWHPSFHFSDITVQSQPLYNYQMSFPNYIHSFFPNPYSYDNLLCPLPYLTYLLPNLPTLEEFSPLTQESKSQNGPKELDFKIVEENLRKLHFQFEHHRKTHWTAEQDKLLQRLVQVEKLEWKQIPKHFEDRTQNMCYSRYRRISMCTKDRNWSKEQEELVIAYVNKLGEKWKLISSKMPKFTPKQIRERYLNYLRPSINKQDFDFEEDLRICRYVLQHGKHWRKMEQLLPGRPQGCIKGRYYGKLQKIIQSSFQNGGI